MSEKYKFLDPSGMYFVTSTIVGWADVFTRPDMKHTIVESLRYCQHNKGLRIHGWCLMPSHLHLIISTVGEPLESIMRDFKKFTSKEIARWADDTYESRREWLVPLFRGEADRLERVKNFKVWQDGNHPIWVSKPKFMKQKLDYIHNNPVAEEIVGEADHYLYSSAGDYFGTRKGYLEIDYI